MRAGRVVVAVLVMVVFVGLAALGYAYMPVGEARPVASVASSPQLVARGQYLATAADCVACHTTAEGQPYAGGREFVLPFGTIYAPNITPDRQTGIGAWSDADFVRAVHEGVGPHGVQLYPAFPYTSYAAMTEADALAIKAYLFSLPPVRGQAPANSLKFPFNQRPMMRLWKLLFFHPKAFEQDPNRSAQWNRGAYLVTALGHCGECHTPRNLGYGIDRGQRLAGETMQGWTAWNITSDRGHGVGAHSQDAVVEYLRYGYAPGMGVAGGPMKEAVDYSLSKLPDEDLRAIAVYLATVPGKARGPLVGVAPAALAHAPMAAPASGDADSPGRRVFEGACAGCHAWNGQGQTTAMQTLAGLPAVNDPRGTNVVQAVLRGLNATAPQGHAYMPAFANAYSDEEIAAVSNYVVARFGGQTGQVSPKMVAKARRD